MGGLFDQAGAFGFGLCFGLGFWMGSRLGGGCGFRLPFFDFEAHAFACFFGENADNVADWDEDVVRYATETGLETDPFVVDEQVFGGSCADAENDLVILDVLCGDAGVAVYENGDVWCVAAVCAPFIEGADEIGFGGQTHF